MAVAWVAWLLLLPVLAAWGGSAPLQVHIVCHTHDDIGWLKTVDQYATGQNTSIQRACTNCILDSVVAALAADVGRTFTYVEQGFFQRWWRVQPAARRRLVAGLVHRGQLQFVNGGWSMHDEAAAHYVDMVDQMTYGHRFLEEQFGIAPTVGWQLDPFGHSATQAALLSAEMGFSALFFGRIDYQDLAWRTQKAAAEFVWRASESLGATAQVFAGLTGSYRGNYGPPPGFCWDITCDDEPMQDDEALKDYNVPQRLAEFVEQVLAQGRQTRGRHVMLTMGSDFQFQSAEDWYRNLDKLIRAANADGRIHLFYSTPEAYSAAKYAEGLAWPLKEDDFFPYADGPHQYWTGYFTSRPALKRYIRSTSAFFQAVRQVVAVSGLGAEADTLVDSLAEAMAVVQHHDAVTGTAKQHVTFDYAARLAEGRQRADTAYAAALAALAGLPPVGAMAQCPLLNASRCPATTAGAPVAALLWNALAQPRREVVELPVSGPVVAVRDAAGRAVPVQVVPALPATSNYGPVPGAPYTALFWAESPALGFATYHINPGEVVGTSVLTTARPSLAEAGDVVLENRFLRVTVCGPSGLLCKIKDLVSGTEIEVEQSYFWYNASTGDGRHPQAAGAYIFRPAADDPIPIPAARPTVDVLRGPLVQEVRQTFAPWLSQRISLADDSQHIEMTYTVGPIPVEDGWGKEVISRFTTSIKNGGRCITDSNGREMLTRVYNHRDTWPLNQTERIAGNYYPVTTAIAIADDAAQLTVLLDASQGGSGLVGPGGEGVLELMVHRRLLVDDGRGVGEPLNETEHVHPYTAAAGPGAFGEHSGPALIIRGRHWVTLTSPAAAAERWRPLQDRLYQPLHAAFTGAPVARPSLSLLAQPLPANVQVMTLERRGPQQALLRLSHQFGLREHPTLSLPVAVDLRTLFAEPVLAVASAVETSLSANRLRRDVRTWAWRTETAGTRVAHPWRRRAPLHWAANTTVTLGPLEVRTFLLRLRPAAPHPAGPKVLTEPSAPCAGHVTER
eukprot:EG_transcript_1573